MDKQYEDIIHLPHHQSAKHRPMSDRERAAQFSPFAALTGYEDCIRETSRLTEQRPEPDEAIQLAIGERLHRLQMQLAGLPRGQGEAVIVEYYIADPLKPGGRCVRQTGTAVKLDSYEQLLYMKNGTKIPLADILSIYGALFEEKDKTDE